MKSGAEGFLDVGPAVLTISDRRFRGRLVRQANTQVSRFHVNLSPSGKVPAGWPHTEEWTEDFNMNDLESDKK